ncbi:MAG: hypothetical protein WD733_05755 [Bryobacterales bacterium]
MFDPKSYGVEIESILAAHEGGDRLMPLAPSEPLRGAALKRLRQIDGRQLFGEKTVAAEDFADCVRSALFLYLSDLDQSHTISQDVPTATGSFLHGVMHRQEPDFGNSKYWFRRVGSHEVFPRLRAGALTMLAGREGPGASAAESLHRQIESLVNWDPFWFIDQCEAARTGAGDFEKGLQEIQRLEWQLLFDYCYHKAIGDE